MKSFRLNDRMEIVANYEKTRNGFRHRARLLVDGREVDQATASYQNRTWESYEFESVINRLIDKTSYINPEMKQRFKNKIAGKSHEETESQFKTVGMVAKLGDIMTRNKKESNVWKKRMLVAGMGAGLQFPDTFDTLPEKTKTERLDKTIGFLTERKSNQPSILQTTRKDNAKQQIKKLISEKMLIPRFDTQKSFYKKAKVKEYNGKKVLQSYKIDVAEIIGGKPHVKGLYSDTTTRHIKEFLRQSGFKAESSKQILKDYGLKSDAKTKKQLKKLMRM